MIHQQSGDEIPLDAGRYGPTCFIQHLESHDVRVQVHPSVGTLPRDLFRFGCAVYVVNRCAESGDQRRAGAIEQLTTGKEHAGLQLGALLLKCPPGFQQSRRQPIDHIRRERHQGVSHGR
jgi:hypothetical protein